MVSLARPAGLARAGAGWQPATGAWPGSGPGRRAGVAEDAAGRTSRAQSAGRAWSCRSSRPAGQDEHAGRPGRRSPGPPRPPGAGGSPLRRRRRAARDEAPRLPARAHGTIMSPPARRRRPPAWPVLPGWPGGTVTSTGVQLPARRGARSTAPPRARRRPPAAPPSRSARPAAPVLRRPSCGARPAAPVPGRQSRGASPAPPLPAPGATASPRPRIPGRPHPWPAAAGGALVPGRRSKIRHPTDVSRCKLQEICHATNSGI